MAYAWYPLWTVAAAVAIACALHADAGQIKRAAEAALFVAADKLLNQSSSSRSLPFPFPLVSVTITFDSSEFQRTFAEYPGL
jgi:hypothetical protein